MILIYSALILIGTCDNAFAYLDPGSGSLVLQMLGGLLIGTLLQARKIINFIKTKFRKK